MAKVPGGPAPRWVRFARLWMKRARRALDDKRDAAVTKVAACYRRHTVRQTVPYRRKPAAVHERAAGCAHPVHDLPSSLACTASSTMKPPTTAQHVDVTEDAEQPACCSWGSAFQMWLDRCTRHQRRCYLLVRLHSTPSHSTPSHSTLDSTLDLNRVDSNYDSNHESNRIDLQVEAQRI